MGLIYQEGVVYLGLKTKKKEFGVFWDPRKNRYLPNRKMFSVINNSLQNLYLKIK